jgi:FtsH-binding integral membrane protein
MLDTASVWTRTHANPNDIISDRAYNAVIGAVLLWGFAMNWVTVQLISPAVFTVVPPLVFLIGYVVCTFAGIYTFQKSSNPLVSFLGYNLVVGPIGLLLVLALAGVPALIVYRALIATAGVTGTMMMLGTLFPAFFLGLGRTLFIALVIGLLAQLGLMLFGMGVPTFFDGLFVLIFSGYIGYDWARANRLPKTLDNAIDSAAALYLDIINLFLRLLRMMRRR